MAAELTQRAPAGGPRDALARAGGALDRARELDARAESVARDHRRTGAYRTARGEIVVRAEADQIIVKLAR